MANFWQSRSPIKINVQKTIVARVQATATEKLHIGFEIPPFSISPLPWFEASYITLEFDVNLENDYSLVIPIKPPAVNVNFCLAVRWLESDGVTVTRYKLWSNIGEDLDYPTYSGQVISKNATYEIWNTTRDTTSLTNSFLLITSILVDNPTCCGYGGLSIISNLPYSRCELFAPTPFLDPNLINIRQYCLEDILLGGGYGSGSGLGYMVIQPYAGIPPFEIAADPHPTGEGVGAELIEDDEDEGIIVQ